MNYIPQFLTGQTVFIEGVGRLGIAKQVTLPKIEQIRQTMTQGGFERSVSSGVFKAMECDLTLSEYHDSVYQAMNIQSASFVIKGSLKQKDKNYSVIATLRGGIDVDDGNWETGKEAERKVKIYCDYYSLEVNKVLQVELDTENMIAVIAGVDHMQDLRNHIT